MEFTQKLNDLYQEIRISIINNIENKGKENGRDFSSYKVVKLPEDLMFNMTNGDYIIEISKDEMFSNDGQIYGYGTLDYEQLVELADWLENL